MSKYEYNYDDSPKPQSRLDIWDLMSILVLLTTGCIVVYMGLIFAFPTSALNPLPPGPSGPPPTATPTITPIPLPATWTPTIFVGTETATLVPTFTIEPSKTPLSLITPSNTPIPTKTPKLPFSATVTYIDSTIIHADLACNWQGIGGTVVDANNGDMRGRVVLLTGSYNGKSKNEPTVSGVAPAYGPAGYEFFLGTVPILSKGQLFVQLLDQAGIPLSDRIPVDTFNDCSKNLALVRFKANP